MSATTQKMIYVTAYNGITDSVEILQIVPQRSRKIDLAKAFSGVGYSSVNSLITDISFGEMQNHHNVLETPDLINFLTLESDMTTTGTLLTNKVIDAGVTAIGIDQSGAYQIVKPISVITVGANTTGLKLPVLVAGSEKFLCYVVENNMGNTINVYPGLADFIGSSAVNVAVTVAAYSRTIFYTKKSTIATTSLKGWNVLTN